jgi:hypothetical protein
MECSIPPAWSLRVLLHHFWSTFCGDKVVFSRKGEAEIGAIHCFANRNREARIRRRMPRSGARTILEHSASEIIKEPPAIYIKECAISLKLCSFTCSEHCYPLLPNASLHEREILQHCSTLYVSTWHWLLDATKCASKERAAERPTGCIRSSLSAFYSRVVRWRTAVILAFKVRYTLVLSVAACLLVACTICRTRWRRSLRKIPARGVIWHQKEADNIRIIYSLRSLLFVLNTDVSH